MHQWVGYEAIEATHRETGDVVWIQVCPGQPFILDGLDA